jgi:hypothetical protein
MYGIIPSAINDAPANAPPVNAFNVNLKDHLKFSLKVGIIWIYSR